ncbi:hypothetical protein [Flavobacterium tibetense]|nr:hypothetical protein [Flavobacterium tibetense]
MTWIIIITIIGVIIYYFLKDRDKMLETQVDNFGGMKRKYSLLIEWLTSDPKARITKTTRDHIEISCIYPSSITKFLITENFNFVEIDWISNLGVMGNHKLNWKFPNNTHQESIIEKIGTDLQNYENSIF